MYTVEQIESAILKLSPQELIHLADWVLDLDEQRWDESFARSQDQLGRLADRVRQDVRAGRVKNIENDEL